MQTPLLIPTIGATLSNSAARLFPPVGGASGSGTTGRVAFAEAGTLSLLKVRLPTTLTTGQYVFEVLKNNVAQSLAVTLTSGESTETDSVNTVTVAAGDDIVIRATPTSTPDVQANCQIAMVFTATASGKSVINTFHAATAASTFFGLGGHFSAGTEASVQVRAPCAGVISKIYVRRATAPGAGTSIAYSLRQNGSDVLTATISDANTTANNTGTINVAAGDLLSIGQVPTGSPASSTGSIGFDWAPSVDGMALGFGTANSGLSAAATRYVGVSGVTADDTEADVHGIAPMAFTLRNMYARAGAAPTAGRSWTFTARKGGADQSITCQIADANQNAEDTSNTVSVAANDLIATSIVPAGTPVGSTVSVAYVLDTAPAATGNPSALMLLGVG